MSDWPFSSGDMAERIRSFDWARTPLGPSRTWPESLKSAVDMMLSAPQIATVTAGPAGVFLYNDQGARYYGAKHPGALGRPLPEVFAHEFARVAPFYERAFAGESLHVPAQPLDPAETGVEASFDAYLTPVRDDAGAVIAVYMTGFANDERRRAEAALRQSEARYRAFVTATSDVVYRMSPDWRELRQLDGQGFLADASAPTQGWADRYVHPDDRALVWDGIQQAIRAKSIFDLEYRVLLANGGVGWTRSRAVPILGADDEIVEWLGSARDVTERRVAADRLRASEERQTFLLRLSDALRPLADPPDIMAVASEALGRHFGAGRCGYGEVDETGAFFVVERDWTDGRMASFRGRHLLASFGPELVSAYRAGRSVLIDDALADARAAGHEAAFAAAGGVRASLGLPLIKNGRFVAGLFVQQSTPRHWSAQDEALALEVAERTWAAVERARAEAARRESEARLAAAFESVPAGIGVLDAEGRIVLFNAELRRFLPTGLMPSQDPDRGWRWRAWDEDGRPVQPQDFPNERAMRGERVIPGQDMLHTEDSGREIWTRVASVPIHGAGGEVIGQASVISDIDALKRAQETQALLVAELQHRVRNILAVVRSVFGRTLEAGGDLEQLADHFSGRLDSLARTQVVVTRDATGTVDLENLVRDELLSAAVHDGPALSIRGPDVALPGKAAESLGLAIHELTTNALKYGALCFPGGSIDIVWDLILDHSGKRRLTLYWTERGVPAVPLQPKRRGFGSELITDALPYQLGAETLLEFRGGGVRCVISLPLPPAGGGPGREEQG